MKMPDKFYQAFKNELNDHYLKYIRRKNLINQISSDLEAHCIPEREKIGEYLCCIRDV